ncbi:MAG: hypothetical protein K2V38_07500, partial [Gemmataceae bacterium]|nr:hypothetical protein [Gemmataceae bacterium]
PVYFTLAAQLPVGVRAEDPLYGVRRAFVEYRVGRDGRVRTLPLGVAANTPPEALVGAGGGLGVVLAPTGNLDVLTKIPIAAFTRDDGSPLREGDLLVIRGAADDWDDVAALKGPGRSPTEHEIRIAAPEAIDAWLQKELAALRPELARVREQQRDSRQRTGEVMPLPGGALSPEDRERLVGAEQGQRAITGRVGDPAQGLRARADFLRETARANNLPKTNTTDRVEIVADRLGQTADRDLNAAQQKLADALRLAGLPKTGQEDELASLLRGAGRSQKRIEDTATELLELLALWGGAGEIRSEARVQKDNILRQLVANEQLKERVKPGALKPTEDEQRDLDRAGVRADQAREQASGLIARAARIAAEKDKQAADLRTQAALKEEEAGALRAKANETTSPLDKSSLTVQANTAEAAAADLRAAADKAAAEADALRKGLEAAG